MSNYKCIYCGSSRGKNWLLKCRDYYLQKPQISDYLECENCNSYQQYPIPSDTSSFYDDYPIHQQKSVFFHYFRKLFFSKAMYSPPATAQGVLLDYGCGDGSYLSEVIDKVPSVLGFEPNSDHAKTLSEIIGVPIYSDEDLLVNECSGQINTVTMHMVLEHLTNLNDTFNNINKLLVDQGLFYILIPNAHSWESKLFKRKWHGLDAPRHISFASDNGIQVLAEKNGFVIDKKYFVSYPTSIAGSIPPLIVNKFNYLLFLACLPVSFIVSRIFPSGSKVYILKKIESV